MNRSLESRLAKLERTHLDTDPLARAIGAMSDEELIEALRETSDSPEEDEEVETVVALLLESKELSLAPRS